MHTYSPVSGTQDLFAPRFQDDWPCVTPPVLLNHLPLLVSRSLEDFKAKEKRGAYDNLRKTVRGTCHDL